MTGSWIDRDSSGKELFRQPSVLGTISVRYKSWIKQKYIDGDWGEEYRLEIMSMRPLRVLRNAQAQAKLSVTKRWASQSVPIQNRSKQYVVAAIVGTGVSRS